MIDMLAKIASDNRISSVRHFCTRPDGSASATRWLLRPRQQYHWQTTATAASTISWRTASRTQGDPQERTRCGARAHRAALCGDEIKPEHGRLLAFYRDTAGANGSPI